MDTQQLGAASPKQHAVVGEYCCHMLLLYVEPTLLLPLSVSDRDSCIATAYCIFYLSGICGCPRTGLQPCVLVFWPQMVCCAELVHLASYKGMGTANVTCVSGCTCPLTQLNATEAGWVSVFRTYRTIVSGCMPHSPPDWLAALSHVQAATPTQLIDVT